MNFLYYVFLFFFQPSRIPGKRVVCHEKMLSLSIHYKKSVLILYMLFDAHFKGVYIHVSGISVNALAHKSIQLNIISCGTF